MNDVKKNEYNLRSVLLHSNANPIGSKDNDGYCCAFCMKKFPSPLNLKKHFLEEHNSETQIANNIGRLFQRLVKIDITDLNCSLCCTDFDALRNFIQHLKEDHNEAVFPDVKNCIVPFKFDSEELRCAICSIEFVTFKLLQEHMHVHYRNYICQICNAGYVNKKAYLNHTKRHDTGEFKCEECDKTFKNDRKLREHFRRSHLGVTKRNKCKFCDERFVDYWKKMAHMVEKHGLPPVVLPCQACDRTFGNQRALARHTRKDHLMEKKHKCSECDMRFFGKSNLQKHMAKHSGLKQFECDVCFKSYARKSTLREHMRIHADDRRFPCEHCGQAFVQKCSWRGHMRSKHGEIV